MKKLLQKVYQTYKEQGLRYLLSEIHLTSRCKTVSRAEDINRRYNHSRHSADYNTDGIDIFEEDWDNLIILDACRYDKFSESHDFDGTLESRTSRGSKTWEFVRANFRDKKLYDTVYISDNPWYGKLAEEMNSELYHYDIFDQDSFEGTVTHPETATDDAIEYAERFDDKRCIIHYYQPHEPYFNEDGTELHRMVSTCPARQRHEGYSHEDIVDAYESTLALVLKEVGRLLNHLNGKTVITSDHGELLGDRMWPVPLKNYEHPEGVYVDELVRVPWFVVEHQEHKEIVEEDGPAERTETDGEEIEEQLQSLGYL